jgi:hypothetical protein
MVPCYLLSARGWTCCVCVFLCLHVVYQLLLLSSCHSRFTQKFECLLLQGLGVLLLGSLHCKHLLLLMNLLMLLYNKLRLRLRLL